MRWIDTQIWTTTVDQRMQHLEAGLFVTTAFVSTSARDARQAVVDVTLAQVAQGGFEDDFWFIGFNITRKFF